MRTTCTRSLLNVANVVTGSPYTVCASSWMPTRMWWALAAATPSVAARTSAAVKTPIRLRNDGLPAEALQHAAQTVLELDLGLPAEQLTGTRDVGLPDLRIVDRQCLVNDLALRARHPQHGLGQLVHRELVRVAEVDRQVLARFGERDEPTDEVVDVAEAPCLCPVPEHGQGLALEGLPDKRGNRAPVVGPHPRPVRVEDPPDRGVDALLPVVRHRHRLGVALRFVIDAARADRIDVPPVGFRLRMDLRVAVDLARRGEQEA